MSEVLVISSTEQLVLESAQVLVQTQEVHELLEVARQGPPGPPGPPGDSGIPAGGTLGQILTKQSGADYDADWQDPPESDNTAEATHAALEKATPVDADELPLVDTEAANVLKKLTWGSLKTALKTYFDGLYLKTIAPLVLATANAIEQRNGTTSQAFRVYNTYTDASNYERTEIGWSSNIARMWTQQAGTGVARSLSLGVSGAASIFFVTNNLTRWVIDSSGHIGVNGAGNNNLFDIGSASAAPRTIYANTSVTAPAHVTNGTGSATAAGVQLAASGQNWIGWNTAGIAAPAVTTRSAGTKAVIYPSLSGSALDYAWGLETGYMWWSVNTTGAGFRWYSGPGSPTMELSGAGLLSAKGVTSSGTGGIGYATGAGGTVTQITSKVTGVTLNFPTGEITTHAGNLNAGQSIVFRLTNSRVSAGDMVFAQHISGGTAYAYDIDAKVVAGGAVDVRVTNNTAGALAEPIVIRFALFKCVTA